jgi:hypothetical protein
VAALKLKIQEATIRATVKLLKEKIPAEASQKDVVLASLDECVENEIAAVLVAAALEHDCTWDDAAEESADCKKRGVTLYIGETKYSVSTPSEVMSLLDQICAKKQIDNIDKTPATTKDVQNLIERHLGPNSHLLLFASTDIKIEQRVLSKLQLESSTIHCHMNDAFGQRMAREKAKVGDVTITLMWDNECDLDLHCICPNGDHIYYGDRYGGGSIGGGYLDVDMNVHGESKEPVENIFFGDAEKGIQAVTGKYKVIVQNYRYHGNFKAGDTIPWKVRVAKNGELDYYSGEVTGAGKENEVTAVEFEYTGRKVPPPEEVGSLLQSSNLVAVTSSTGDSLDSIAGLMSIFEEHAEISNIQNLIQTEANHEPSSEASPAPLMAQTNYFTVTSRDRLYLKLSKLPKLFHEEVNSCFAGSTTLIDFTASVLAKRLITDEIPIEQLKYAGYQEEIINLVTEKMQKLGM